MSPWLVVQLRLQSSSFFPLFFPFRDKLLWLDWFTRRVAFRKRLLFQRSVASCTMKWRSCSLQHWFSKPNTGSQKGRSYSWLASIFPWLQLLEELEAASGRAVQKTVDLARNYSKGEFPFPLCTKSHVGLLEIHLLYIFGQMIGWATALRITLVFHYIYLRVHYSQRIFDYFYDGIQIQKEASPVITKERKWRFQRPTPPPLLSRFWTFRASYSY